MNLTNNNYDSKTNRFNNEYIANKNNNTNSIQASESVSTGRTTSQELSTLLQKGNNFEGTITDIRQNEVNIQLKDGSNLTAKITNPSSLQIGQTADFKVVYQSEKSIGIEVVSENQTNSMEPTVIKALEGASLPINDKNQLIVKELLDNNMSIDKQTLLNVLRDSYMHPEASIDTLVRMNKYNIPVTDENIAQFDQYKNLEHRIMNGVTTISNELSNIIEELLNTGSSDDIHNFHLNLTNLLGNNLNGTINGIGTGDINVSNATFTPNIHNLSTTMLASESLLTAQSDEGIINPMTGQLDSSELTNLTSDSITPNSLKDILFDSSKYYMTGNLTTNMLTVEERNILLSMINTELISQEDKASLLNGTLDFQSVLTLIDASSRTKASAEPFNEAQTNLLLKLGESVQLVQSELGNLSSILSSEERATLYNELQKFPLSEELKHSILNGSLSNNDFIKTMQSILSSDNAFSTQDILKNKSYQKLLQETLQSKWSLTPKSLMEEGSVENLYKTLQNDLDGMKKLLEHTNISKDTMSYNVNNLKDNLNFMKAINEMFTYVQLPVKLRNQNLHSDLYIYTNKKELKDKKDNISVLLHLDMDHLGPTDIHLTLSNTKVIAKFYLSDEESKELIEDNLELLETALNNKGYFLSSEVNLREKDVNLVDDLLEQNTQTTAMKRYSFDIRT